MIVFFSRLILRMLFNKLRERKKYQFSLSLPHFSDKISNVETGIWQNQFDLLYSVYVSPTTFFDSIFFG